MLPIDAPERSQPAAPSMAKTTQRVVTDEVARSNQRVIRFSFPLRKALYK
jgi:hypothetical protein